MVEKEEPVEYVVMIKEFKSLHKSHFWLDKSNKKKKKKIDVWQSHTTDIHRCGQGHRDPQAVEGLLQPYKST